MQTILISTPSISFHDAVSNDVWQLEEFLTRQGFNVYVYAEHAPERNDVHVISFEQASLLVRQESTIWIYHHSVFWHLGEVLWSHARCKVIFRYHNITPPEFFERYGETIATFATKQGLAQTKRLLDSKLICGFINDSQFNSQDLIALGADPKRSHVVAPLHKVNDFGAARVNEEMLKEISADDVNILFVGRFAPNKGHLHALDVVAHYIQLFGEKVKLHLAGNLGSIPKKYLHAIQARVAELEIGEQVKIWGGVDLNGFYTLMRHCHVFLLMSEHEGFCVPIVEAQNLGVPVIALDRTAVAETLGSDQLCFKDLDFDQIAAAVHTVAKNSEVRDFLVAAGKKNERRFEHQVLEKKFLEAMTQLGVFGDAL